MTHALENPPAGDVPDAVLAAAQPTPVERRINFWRRPWVQSVIPFVTSLSVHVGIITIALVLLASGAFQYIVEKVTQPQANIPTATLAETSIGGMPSVGNMDDVTSQSAQLDPVEQSRNPLPEGRGDSIDALMNSDASSAASITGITGMGSLADALGGGGGGGEGSTMFGEPGGGGKFMGFDFGTAGDGSAVTRVVFVCDASGSMEGEPKVLLIGELKEAIGPLKPIQFFNVIFFQWDDYSAAFQDSLKSASPNNKTATYTFLDRVTVRGGTNPLPALEAAFRMKPQLIFFLTDGRFDQAVGYDQVLEKINQLNSDKQVMVNTIQFINRDETAEGVLRTIASENGGKYKFIGEDDL